MKRFSLVVFLLLLIIVCLGCTEHIENKPVKQDVATIDELKTVLNELRYETAIDTVQALINVPINIEWDYVDVKGKGDIITIIEQEYVPYRSKRDFRLNSLIGEGKYIRYSCKYSEECDNGSAKFYHITVFVKVEDNGEFCSPLHLYAYNRVCEKRAGMLEAYTVPEWDISYTVVK